MARFINPYSDYGFKLIFGREISKDLLIDFLNDLLVGERVILDLTFLNTEQSREYPESRGIIYDIYCTTDTGEKIIVEMQNRSQPNFRDRGLYYLSNAIVSQGLVGSNWNFTIKAVYGVFFMNFEWDNNQKIRTDVVLADRETHELFSDKLRQIYIALPRFTKSEEECETDFERWLYVLKNMETLDRMPFKARKAVFKKLEEIADLASLPIKERAVYEQNLKVYRDYIGTLAGARLEGLAEGREEGRAKGLAEGREEGLTEGREEGLTEGREEGLAEGRKQERISNARNLKALAVSPEIIIQVTGLTLDEIEEL